jgi:hypothetical protein
MLEGQWNGSQGSLTLQCMLFQQTKKKRHLALPLEKSLIRARFLWLSAAHMMTQEALLSRSVLDYETQFCGRISFCYEDQLRKGVCTVVCLPG